MLLPVRQEICDPPAGGVVHVQLGELLLQQCWDDVMKDGTKVHKQGPGMGFWGVQVKGNNTIYYGGSGGVPK